MPTTIARADPAPAASAPAFELLESKLLPPRAAGSVSRSQLVQQLEGSRAIPVVVLSTGPGWGKTTLLAEWTVLSDRRFAWVHVDAHDNDPIVLLTYIAEALNRVAPIDAGVFEALATPGVSVEGTVLPRLGAALGAIPEPTVLVLDDLHLLENPACFDALATVTSHVPNGSQVAFSLRDNTGLPLGPLRAHALVLEIGVDDLRMDDVEASQLMSAAGVDLSEEDLADLTDQTEGWCAGLYLAALSMGRRGMKPPTASTAGSNQLVADYLRSELLAHLSEEDRRFLTRTSVLESMSGPLCDALLDRADGAQTLETLAHSNLFLVPLDTSGEWYRYHHLFQELLRAELAHTEEDLVPELLAHAIDWCEAEGRLDAAIGYAQQAGDVARVARLFEVCVLPTYESGRTVTVERWLEWLEAHGALDWNAAVAVLGGLVATVQGRPAEADRRADLAERAGYDGTLPDGSESIDSWLALLRAMRCRRGVATMRADAELAVGTLARASPYRPVALLMMAIAHLLEGEMEQADDVLTDVAEEGLEVGMPEAVIVALGERAVLAIERGAWVEAEELVDRSLRVIRRSRIGEYPTSALVYALAARVGLHRGKTAPAHEHLAHAQRLRPRLTYALPHVAVQTRLELARAYLTLADAGGARMMLREIGALLRRQPDLGCLSSQVEELRSRLDLLRAEAPGASTLTEAELRVLPHLATHLSFREIGERLYLSQHTVKSHAMAIYRKLNVTSRSGAVDRAHELGLL